MGYIRHKGLIVNHWDSEAVVKAHADIMMLYTAVPYQANFAALVSPVLFHITNGGASFFIAPDGSKEGWEDSNIGDALMDRAKELLSKYQFLDWCEVLLGGDDDQFAVLESTSDNGEDEVDV